MDYELIKTLAVVIGTIVGLITLIKGLVEYKRQGVVKRTEIFLEMRTRLREDESFSNICNLLETDDEELRKIPLIERDRFVGFFEELALIHNSKLINNLVTLYMFGYYSIRCSESKNFWYKLNKNQPLWSAFFDFADKMKNEQRKFKFQREEFHL